MTESTIAHPSSPAANFVPPGRQRWTGARIKALRTAHRLTQNTFAEVAGVSSSTVSAWERGERLQGGVMHRLLDYVAAGLAGGAATPTNGGMQ